MEEIERFLASPSFSDATRRSYRFDLEQFAGWLGRGRRLEDVDLRVLSDYAAELGRRRPKLAPAIDRPEALLGPLAAALRAWRGARARRGRSRRSGRGGCRRRRRPPRSTRCSKGSRATEQLGLRNRALVELIYSAGLRSAEAVGLDLQDVDFEQELLHVRGKGGKERDRPARRGGRATASPAISAKAARSSREAPRTRSSSPPAAGGSTRARSGASSRTRTACGTPSPPTCSRAAPTCA